ncbi:MAG: aromatic ring-hydroxylating dioxygenase subunit alpha [Planctomycetes bacterium]|nr:aromatic ring-hydroxylating dioxygenase subunit alpha [Planctomycetota bacterium]
MLPFPTSPDIHVSQTLHADFYRDPAWFTASREKIFARSWQFLGDTGRVKTPGSASPLTILDGCLSEPALLSRDSQDRVHLLSNVCTHRGNLLCEGDAHGSQLRCRYHGRKFALDGHLLSSPGFEGAKDFPSKADNLPEIPSASWSQFLFASIVPPCSFEDFAGVMTQRLAWLPLQDFTFEPSLSRDYLVAAHWALYVENYLEGFHVPFVHASLAATLNPDDYTTELFPRGNLQLGIASSPGDAFRLPPSSPDHGRHVAAYYYWLFPNTMLNFYPWGLSANVVVPLAPDRTRVSYQTWVWDRSRLNSGAGAGLDRVEREDEAIVEEVQKGIRSRLYQRGRYSPKWETGVHQFHTLLGEALR